MKDSFDPGASRRNDEYRSPGGNSVRPSNHFRAPGQQSQVNGHNPKGVDAWTIVDLLLHRWVWLVLGFVVFAAGAGLAGLRFIKPKFTASAQLLRYETAAAKDFFQSTPMSAETFAGLIRSPDLLRIVGTNMSPAMMPEVLTKHIKVEPESDSDVIKVMLALGNREQAVSLLNLYLEQVVRFTSEYQTRQAQVVAHNYLKQELAQMDEDVSVLENQFRGTPAAAQMTNKLSEVSTNLTALSNHLASGPRSSAQSFFLTEQLNKALSELAELSAKYYDIHPAVQQKQAQVDALRQKIAAASTNSSLGSGGIAGLASGLGPNAFNPELDIIRTKLLSVEEKRVELANRQREAELFATNPPGMVRILAPATLATVQTNWRQLKIGAVSVFGGGLGMVVSLFLVMLVELTDRRVRTAADVERVTGLPLLATLGDLSRMGAEQRALWAFRAWTMMQGRLSRSANHGLVCGVTSCSPGEGRSTWIGLLAEAASMAGFRVLTIATKPSPTHVEYDEDSTDPLKLEAQVASNNGHNGNGNHANQEGALTSNVLASPAQVTEQLTGPQSQPMVHIPLPGWVWNLERRKQWRDALNHWRRIDNLVIFVELPPANVAEAVLLGSNLPNLVWLADSGSADAAETRAQLRTLQHARCNLVGAVLNRDSNRSTRKRFPRWVAAPVVAVAMGLASANGQTATNVPAPGPEPAAQEPAASSTGMRSLSVVSPAQRAAWQQHLTLGPGDVLTVGLYGAPDLTVTEMAIAPDGMINYLEATNVLATGLSIDELRAKLDQELGQYRRSPRTLITPVAFRSKKYYVLGRVMTKGVFTLDRPLTVLEAIARAHGVESALVDRNIVDLADFQHSFLMRGGKRISLNFERLFQQGDLSQNIAIEPGDYLYFPPTDIKEVYVVGEVRLPGPVTFTPTTTIIAAISARGGYTDRAFKARVLVVRGSLNNPQTFAVDTHAILDARAPDFQLQPRDIIYVNSRPFIRVEELADLAATAFIQSLITSWIGVDVVKPIQ